MSKETQALAGLQEDINELRGKNVPVGSLSDGHHSYDELYQHRNILFIALCKEIAGNDVLNPIWCTHTQSDGTPVQDGWFLLGINKKAGKQISYHIPECFWDVVTDFAKTTPKAPDYDGHTGPEVLKRIASL